MTPREVVPQTFAATQLLFSVVNVQAQQDVAIVEAASELQAMQRFQQVQHLLDTGAGTEFVAVLAPAHPLGVPTFLQAYFQPPCFNDNPESPSSLLH